MRCSSDSEFDMDGEGLSNGQTKGGPQDGPRRSHDGEKNRGADMAVAVHGL